ncbi:family 43 glycosylhydrolase [Gracilibacillus sp. JCM 18860]|uniref:family 43 glycosylhydrolase n=1 Tax=Gracilibacillus sp. JCM 18860 TaxID=1306159 RepID=UPI000B040451
MNSIKKKTYILSLFLLVLSLFIASSYFAKSKSGTKSIKASTTTFTNPINTAGADPYVMLHSDGYYYFTRTLGHRIDIWKSRTLTGIELGERKTIWTKPDHLKDIWAPEIHYINGKWYIYYTANTGCGDACRGVYVLENDSPDPLQGEWIEKGKVNTQYDGLDGSVFEHKGKLYFMYAAYGDWSGEHGSAVAVAPMSNPWTLDGENVILTYPEYDWEKKGMHVNEGAVILKRNGKVYLVYSGSACWEDDYAIGILTASEDSNLLDPHAWSKSKEPVFKKSIKNSVYGPGHNSFVPSKDGTEDWIVYHGNSAPGQGCSARPTRIQKFSWNEDGTPNFGEPSTELMNVPSGGEYKIEAEHGIINKAKVNDRPGQETVTLNNKNSSILIEDVNVPEAGTYTITVKYANNARPDAENYIYVNDQPVSILTYPYTGKKNFEEVTMEVDLNKGGYDNTIKFMKKKHVVEIDYVEISGEVNFSIESGVEYKLVNPNGGKVLDVEDGSYNVRTWDGSDVTLSQRWRMTDVGDGKYSVKNTNSGKYLTVDGDLTAPWVNVNLQAWNGTDAQKWSIEKVSNKYYKLINVANGKALDVDGASIDRGANIGTWEDLPSGPAQMWLFYPLD